MSRDTLIMLFISESTADMMVQIDNWIFSSIIQLKMACTLQLSKGRLKTVLRTRQSKHSKQRVRALTKTTFTHTQFCLNFYLKCFPDHCAYKLFLLLWNYYCFLQTSIFYSTQWCGSNGHWTDYHQEVGKNQYNKIKCKALLVLLLGFNFLSVQSV